MTRFAIAGVAALAIAGSTAVYAQYHPWIREHVQHMRMTPEDRAAFVDARIEFSVAVHVGVDDEIGGIGNDHLVVDHGHAERRNEAGFLNERGGLVGFALGRGVKRRFEVRAQ